MEFRNKSSIPFREDERVMTVHFEDILNSPQQTAKKYATIFV